MASNSASSSAEYAQRSPCSAQTQEHNNVDIVRHRSAQVDIRLSRPYMEKDTCHHDKSGKWVTCHHDESKCDSCHYDESSKWDAGFPSTKANP